MLVLESTRRTVSGSPFRAEIPQLVGEVGTSNFTEALSKTIQSLLQCRQITVFAFNKVAQPRIVSLFAKERAEAVKSAALLYSRSHWHQDPSNIFRSQGMESGKSYAVVMANTDVKDQGFRHDCYTKPGVSHRLSIISQFRDECIKTSFHRTRAAGAFTEDSVRDLLEHSDILTSLLVRHSETASAGPGGADEPEHYETILKARCPELTDRERQVCSLIAVGMSSEAIALTLDVSINTVLTFRRRAYARLRISTQNELLRLLFRDRIA